MVPGRDISVPSREYMTQQLMTVTQESGSNSEQEQASDKLTQIQAESKQHHKNNGKTRKGEGTEASLPNI